MLVRPAAQGFEVFMLRRSAASSFAPDVYVFPGGTVDAGDASDRALARAVGLESDRLAREFRAGAAPPEAPALLIAALRELYEEAGVLLVADRNGRPIAPARLRERAQRLHAARPLVQRGELAFSALLDELDFYADAAALARFSQWVTPSSEPRRYDAHFFVASVEADRAALADAYETHDGRWIAPHDALAGMADGSFRMVYPTIKHIERLARFDDAHALVAFARSKPIARIEPDTIAERGFSIAPQMEFTW
jgi:8-oxo-dGTP pyrophosphatase MutT (NUDIX family)